MRYTVQVSDRLGKPLYNLVDEKYGYNIVATFFDRDLADDTVEFLNHKEEAHQSFLKSVGRDIKKSYSKVKN